MLAALALTGCLGHDSSKPPADVEILGAPVRLADCADWRRGSFNDRYGAVKSLKSFAGGPVGTSGRRGASFDDLDAIHVLSDGCKPRYAKFFKLYKLYTRAAAFRTAGSRRLQQSAGDHRPPD